MTEKSSNLIDISSLKRGVVRLKTEIAKPIVLFIHAAVALMMVIPAQGQETALFFKQNCASCHWIGGGRLIGPDLQDVNERQERDWLVRFIVDPRGMLDSKDPYAMKLQAEAKGAIMINVPGMTRAMAETLLDFIEAESKLETSKFAGSAVPTGPYSEADAAAGSQLFAGKTGLGAAGPSCVFCHTVNAVGSSLGGRLGPDLTDVFARLQGRAALTAWLSAPPTSTMRAIFKGKELDANEVKTLVAYFESVSGQNNYNYDGFMVWMFAIFGCLGGSVLCLVLFGGIWDHRFRSVRRVLVNESKLKR